MHGDHLVSHIHQHEVREENVIHVIGVCSNPARYHSRMRLAREWIEAMLNTKNVKLTVVEAAFGDRKHELIKEHFAGDFHKIDVRINSHAWIKESMMSLAARRIVSIFPKSRYFGWFDMDVFFNDPNWAQETIHQLQYFEVVQPWSDAIDMGVQGNILRHFKSFGSCHQRRVKKQKHPSQPYEYAHSGFAWCCTRKFLEGMWGAGGTNGPFMDWSILGSADHHMAFAMIGETKDTIHAKMHKNFFRRCYEWEERAVRITNKEVGFTPGYIAHRFHGPKSRRYYRERWEILVENIFDPDKMIAYNEEGIAVLVGNKKLEHAIYQYNLSRFEDSIEER